MYFLVEYLFGKFIFIPVIKYSFTSKTGRVDVRKPGVTAHAVTVASFISSHWSRKDEDSLLKIESSLIWELLFLSIDPPDV